MRIRWLSTVRLSGRSQLAVAGAVIVALIALADAVFLGQEHAASIERGRTSVADLADSYAAEVFGWMKAIDSELVTCRAALAGAGVTAEATIKPLDSGGQTTLNACKRYFDGTAALILNDADGKPVASTAGKIAAAPNMSQEDVFRALKAGAPDRLLLSRPLSGTGPGLSYYALRRLTGSDGHFSGTIGAEVLISQSQLYISHTLPRLKSTTYARRDGIILMSYPPDSSRLRIPADSPWYAVTATGAGTFVSAAAPGRPARLVAVHVVTPPGLVIDVSMPQSEVLADYNRRQPWTIGVGVALAVSVILLLRILAAHYAGIERAKHLLAEKNALLEITEGRLQATFGNISQGISLFGSDARLIVSNRRYAEIYRIDPNRIVAGISLADIVALRVRHGSGPMELAEDYVALIAAVPPDGEDRLINAQLRDGRTVAILQRRMQDGGWVATHEDITERRRDEAKIAFLARHDVLTGLPNRVVFHDLIERALPEAARGAMFAVLFLDLDRFKAVNDTLGHGAGDALLKQVASRLGSTVREIDTVARFGGDEFVVLQPLVDQPAGAMRLAERIIAALCEPYMLEGKQASIGVSIGIAMAPGDGASAEALLKNADLALYLAKAEGRGTFRFFEPEMDARLVRRHDIERDLRTAMAEGGLDLHYQPIVNLQSGAVRAFEALIRWNHPVHGPLPPSEFIPIAEECGLILQVGEWVLRRACRQAASWPESIHVSVNLSPLQFRGDVLVDLVAAVLARSGLAAARLELEITETVLLADSQANIATLHSLRRLGVSVAMDDFGVGYSSLSYLYSFPFDRVKIDGSFVANMMQRREARHIVRAITGLCRDLGMRTTAEGIETREQLDLLRDLAATDGQGYFFGKAMPAAQVDAFLDSSPFQPARTSALS